MLPCQCFLDPCVKLIFTQVFFVAIVMDEQNFLVSTCGRLVSFASTLVALTIERLIIPCVFVMWTSLLLIQPLYLQQHTYKDPSQDLVPNNLTIRYFRFLELFLTYMRI